MVDISPLMILVLILAGLAAILVYWRFAKKPPKRRIVIHDATKIKIQAQGKKTCPACQDPLDGLPLARCKRDLSHVIHAECKELVKSICPECKGEIG